MSKIKHVLGISGGKDSAALAIYLNKKHPQLDLDYYFCDTGRELDETYELIEKLETVLNKKITRLEAVKNSPSGSPFDHYLDIFGGYLPSLAVPRRYSSCARWIRVFQRSSSASSLASGSWSASAMTT